MAESQAEVWIQRALKNRPDILQLEQALKSNEERVRAAKGLFSPSVLVSGSWGFDRSSTLRYTLDDQSSAGAVEVRWQIFAGGSRHAQVRRAQSELAETRANLNRRRLAVQSEVHQAVIDIRKAQEEIRLQRQTLEAARENRRIVRAAYLAGKEPLSRLNETQRDFIEADANLARARIRLRLSWSDLYAAAAEYRSRAEHGADQNTASTDESD